MSEDRYTAGMKARREVLGDAQVDSALAATTDFDADFQTFMTEGAWGSVWARPGLTRREHSLVTIAILAGLGRAEQLVLHTRATRNTGASPDDIKETLFHVAVYAGVPAAVSAFNVVKKTLAEMDQSAADG